MKEKEIQTQQISKVQHYFAKHTGTMLMCSYAIGIERASICRYVRTIEKAGSDLKRIKKGFCPISKHRATFFTIQSSQLTLF
ncbi:MAG: hypothetical protein WCJ03_09215 [Bacteroidales bacterium]